MVKRCLGCMNTYDDYDKVCPHCGYIEGTVPENAMHLMPGIVLNNRFLVGKVVGYGGFGVTYLGWDKVLAQKVAIKEYLPSEFSTRAPGNTFVTIFDGDKKEQFNSGKHKFVDEAKRLSKFTECPGIVKVFDSFVENDTAYIVMEYVDGVTLEDYFKERRTVPADEAILMMLPVIESLQKVHETGVIHRDIAPNNIMVSEAGDVKLIDFGAARFATATHTKSMTVIIKPGYSPEEQYMSRGDQGPHTDVYAVGATLYKMITGVVPPDAMERRAQFQAKGKDILEPISKYNKDISKNLENAIMNAMNVEISTRTPDMATFMYELTTDEPVVRRNGKIKITDVYRWPVWLKITIPVVAMLVLTLSVLFGMGVIGFDKKLNEEMQLPDGMVTVPWVVNKSQEEASVIMSEKQLLMVTEAGDYSDDIEAGMVMKQGTTGGAAVFANSRVYVTLSRGKEMKTIPVSVALYADAQVVKSILEELGFVVTLSEEKEYSNIPKGLVTALVTEDGQQVEANMDLPVKTSIFITASKGPDPNIIVEAKKIKVPNFINLTKQKAYELAGAEISIQIEDKYNKDYEPGIIWYQSVDADTEVENTVVITLYASVSNTVKVPKVTEINYNDAIKELEALGFEYKLEYSEHESYAKDVVYRQSHEQGTMLEQGSVITLMVSKGAGKQDVPDVTGKDEGTAKNTLSNLGYVVAVNYANSDTVANGKVISQDIVGTKVAEKGDTITITVSSGEQLIVVPDVVGKNKADANELLEKAGFKVEVYEQYDDYVSAGTVISQSEKAGTSLKKDTKILITVSLGEEKIVVPDVVGDNEAAASSALESAGFVVSINEKYSDSVAAGIVMEQSETAGTSHSKGTKIVITVSKGAAAWSDWVSELPNGVTSDNYIIEETDYYRSATLEKDTSKTESSRAGWEMYNSTYVWEDRGNWSEWSTDAVSGSESRLVESKTQYSYRDIVITQEYSDWSDWGDWMLEVREETGDLKQVESRTVYGYYYYGCPSCGAHIHGWNMYCPTWAGGCGRAWLTSDLASFTWSPIPYDAAGMSEWCGTGKYYTYLDGELVFRHGSTATEYRYSTRTLNDVTTYTDWSAYSDEVYTASESREVQSQTVYRYNDLTKVTTYYFKRWGEWSEWTPDKVSSSDTVKVETTKYYRYKEK